MSEENKIQDNGQSVIKDDDVSIYLISIIIGVAGQNVIKNLTHKKQAEKVYTFLVVL